MTVERGDTTLWEATVETGDTTPWEAGALVLTAFGIGLKNFFIIVTQTPRKASKFTITLFF